MDNKTAQDPSTTEVLPAAGTPPTQEIAQATTQPGLPRGPRRPRARCTRPTAPPRHGPRRRRKRRLPPSRTRPRRDDADPLAPLRDPAPVPATAGRPLRRRAGPAHRTQPTQQAQPAQPAAQAATKRGPRVGTAVWGLIVIAVGLGILAVAAGVVFDVGAALIVLLGAAGVILVVGSVVSSIRRR